MKKMIQTPLILAMGTTLLSSFAVTVAHADVIEKEGDLFTMTELSTAHTAMLNKDEEGKCGEGKCGEGTCGDKNPS